MKYLFDTDHITFFQRGAGAEFARLSARMAPHPGGDFAFAVISFREQVLGAHAYINRAKSAADLAHGYAILGRILAFYSKAAVLPFDAHAGAAYDGLLRLRTGVAKMDLRVAAVALANGLTLLTRNVADFAKVPGLATQDWTV